MLELVTKLSKVSGNKINIGNSSALLYTENEQSKNENKKRTSFTIELKIIKYQGIHLTKEVRDLHTENYKMLLK